MCQGVQWYPATWTGCPECGCTSTGIFDGIFFGSKKKQSSPQLKNTIHEAVRKAFPVGYHEVLNCLWDIEEIRSIPAPLRGFLPVPDNRIFKFYKRIIKKSIFSK
jgi:hypothetical protein